MEQPGKIVNEYIQTQARCDGPEGIIRKQRLQSLHEPLFHARASYHMYEAILPHNLFEGNAFV